MSDRSEARKLRDRDYTVVQVSEATREVTSCNLIATVEAAFPTILPPDHSTTFGWRDVRSHRRFSLDVVSRHDVSAPAA